MSPFGILKQRRYSLTMLFVAITLAAIALAVAKYSERGFHQRQLELKLPPLGGGVCFDYMLKHDLQPFHSNMRVRSPFPWLSERVGAEWVSSIAFISFWETGPQAESAGAILYKHRYGLFALRRAEFFESYFGLESASALTFCPQLEWLTVARSGELSDESIRKIGKLHNLRTLELGHAGVDDSNVHLLSLESMPRLRELSIYSSALGLKSSRIIGRLTQLEKLSLNDASISNSFLYELKGLSELHELNLCQSRSLTDESIPILIGFRNLEKLDIASNCLSQVGIDIVKHNLPKCEIKLWK